MAKKKPTKKLTAAAKRKAFKIAKAHEAKHLKAANKARLLAEHVLADDIAKAARIAQEHEEAALAAVPKPGWFERWFGN